MDGIVDVGGDLPPHDRTNEAHQFFRIAQLVPLNGLHNDEEGVVQFIFEVLGAQLAAQVVSDSARKGADTTPVMASALPARICSTNGVHETVF